MFQCQPAQLLHFAKSDYAESRHGVMRAVMASLSELQKVCINRLALTSGLSLRLALMQMDLAQLCRALVFLRSCCAMA